MLLPFEQGERKVLVKKEAITDPAKNSALNKTSELLEKGIIILDKPPGPTSHQVVDYLKKVLELKKAGHTGTLDPGVTGVLPIALSKATRITNSLLVAGKEYVCLLHLHSDVDEEELEQAFKAFRGEIDQLPPKKSAVKRRMRKRNVYYLEYIDRKDRDVLIRVGCQAGTYIRKLVHDLGDFLGTGAHMVELRRTKAGPFKEVQSFTLQDVADAYHYYKEGNDLELKKMLLPIEKGVEHLKKIWVHDSAVSTLAKGAYLKLPGVVKLNDNISNNELVAVMTLKDELILVGEALMNSEEIMRSKKGVVVKTSQVFIEPNVY